MSCCRRYVQELKALGAHNDIQNGIALTKISHIYVQEDHKMDQDSNKRHVTPGNDAVHAFT